MTDMIFSGNAHDLAVRLVLTLGHFLWQGAIVGFAAWGLMLACRHRTPRASYLLLLLALASLPVAAATTFVLVEPKAWPAAPTLDSESVATASFHGRPAFAEAARARSPVPTDEHARPARMAEDPDAVEQRSNLVAGNDPQSHIDSPTSTSSETSVKSAEPRLIALDGNRATNSGTDWSKVASESNKPAATDLNLPTERWKFAVPLVASGYLFGVVVMLCRLLIGLRVGTRLRILAEPVSDAALLECLCRRAEGMRLRCVPTLAWCREIVVPTVVGVCRPVILLPVTLASGLSTEQIEALLVHELGHIRRWDPIVNVLQRLIEAVFFFHPVTWLLSRRLRLERELCTDELVVDQGVDSLQYAHTLVEVASQALTGRSLQQLTTVSLQAVDRPSDLTCRVHRLLASRSRELVPVRGVGLSLLGLTLCCGIALAGVTTDLIDADQTDAPSSNATATEGRTEEVSSCKTGEKSARVKRDPRALPTIPDAGWTNDEFAQALVEWVDRRVPFQQTIIQKATRYRLEQIVRTYAPDRIDAKLAKAWFVGIQKYADTAWPKPLNSLDDYKRDDYYINSPQQLMQLEWQIFYAVRRRPFDAETQAELDRQREWIRDYIRSLKPLLKRYGPNHKNARADRLKEFQDLIDNAIFPFFHEPLPAEQFKWFTERMDRYRQSESELLFAVYHSVSSWQNAAFRENNHQPPLPKIDSFPRAYGFGASNLTPRINFSEGDIDFAGSRNTLEDFHSDIMLTADQRRPGTRSLIPKEFSKQGIEGVRKWAEGQKWHGLVYDREKRTLEGLRGAKLLGLPTKLWLDSDRISTNLLRKFIRLRGRMSWSIPRAALVRQPFGDEAVNAMVAVLLPDDRVFVMRVNGIGKHTGVAYRARYHETRWPVLSPLTGPEADLLLGRIGSRRVRQRLKKDLLLRRHDRGLESQVNQFVTLVQLGNREAIQFLSEELHPRVQRLLDWTTTDGGEELKTSYQRLRQEIRDGRLKVGENGYDRVLLGPDLGMNVASTGKRAFIRLVMTKRGQQRSPTLLLIRDGAWKIVGMCDDRETANDFLRDAPSHDPRWSEVQSVTATMQQVVRGHYLDIDSGKTFPAPDDGATAAWRRKNGIDAKFGTDVINPKQDGAWGVVTYDMRQPAVLDGESSVTPAQAIRLIREATESKQRAFLGTQLFRTQEGTVGVLQTQGARDGSVTLRFKTLSPETVREAEKNSKSELTAAKPGPPIERDWTRDKSGVEYRIRQEHDSWKLGETPLLYIDFRNTGDDPHLATFNRVRMHTLKFDRTDFGYSSNIGGSSTLLSDGVTIPVLLHAHWISGSQSRSLEMTPGLHEVRFRINPHRVGIVRDGVRVQPPQESKPASIETLPVTVVIEDEEVRAFDAASQNLRRELLALGKLPSHRKVPHVIEHLVVDNKPDSIGWLMAHAEGNDDALAVPARLLAQRLSEHLPDGQLQRLLTSLFDFRFRMRKEYPRGIPAEIHLFSYFSDDDSPLMRRSDQDRSSLKTTMQVEVDGEPFGTNSSDSTKPLASSSWSDYPMPRTGRTTLRLPTQNLAAGVHTLKIIKTYEYERGDRKIRAGAVSDVKTFRIIESTEDVLIASEDRKVDAMVDESFEIAESSLKWRPGKPVSAQQKQQAWSPQTWSMKDGKQTGVHGPVWRLRKRLPVDLCFEVTARIKSTGEEVKARPLVVLKSDPTEGWIEFEPAEPRLSAAADKEGFVEVELTLEPSREVALTNPKVTRYFPGAKTVESIRLKVWTSDEQEAQ